MMTHPHRHQNGITAGVVLGPQLLLILATLFWAGNFIVGRLVRQDMTPVTLTFWRWIIALAILLPLNAGEIRAHWRAILAAWKLIVALGATGITAFTVCVYQALQATTAVNAALVMATLPLMIVLAGRVLHQERITPAQGVGLAVSLVGAIVIVAQGNLAALLAFQFNPGDLWMLIAVPIWALYAVLQKRRPAVLSPLTLVTASIGAGVLLLLPGYLWELSQGVRTAVNVTTAWATIYTAIGSSAIAYVLWNRGAAVLGPARAGVYINLIPVFSALMAVVLLGEALAGYHLVGAGLVAGGIMLGNLRQFIPNGWFVRTHEYGECGSGTTLLK